MSERKVMSKKRKRRFSTIVDGKRFVITCDSSGVSIKQYKRRKSSAKSFSWHTLVGVNYIGQLEF